MNLQTILRRVGASKVALALFFSYCFGLWIASNVLQGIFNSKYTVPSSCYIPSDSSLIQQSYEFGSPEVVRFRTMCLAKLYPNITASVPMTLSALNRTTVLEAIEKAGEANILSVCNLNFQAKYFSPKKIEVVRNTWFPCYIGAGFQVLLNATSNAQGYFAPFNTKYDSVALARMNTSYVLRPTSNPMYSVSFDEGFLNQALISDKAIAGMIFGMVIVSGIAMLISKLQDNKSIKNLSDLFCMKGKATLMIDGQVEKIVLLMLLISSAVALSIYMFSHSYSNVQVIATLLYEKGSYYAFSNAQDFAYCLSIPLMALSCIYISLGFRKHLPLAWKVIIPWSTFAVSFVLSILFYVLHMVGIPLVITIGPYVVVGLAGITSVIMTCVIVPGSWRVPVSLLLTICYITGLYCFFQFWMLQNYFYSSNVIKIVTIYAIQFVTFVVGKVVAVVGNYNYEKDVRYSHVFNMRGKYFVTALIESYPAFIGRIFIINTFSVDLSSFLFFEVIMTLIGIVLFNVNFYTQTAGFAALFGTIRRALCCCFPKHAFRSIAEDDEDDEEDNDASGKKGALLKQDNDKELDAEYVPHQEEEELDTQTAPDADDDADENTSTYGTFLDDDIPNHDAGNEYDPMVGFIKSTSISITFDLISIFLSPMLALWTNIGRSIEIDTSILVACGLLQLTFKLISTWICFKSFVSYWKQKNLYNLVYYSIGHVMLYLPFIWLVFSSCNNFIPTVSTLQFPSKLSFI